ncbi:MAPEG family protein [Pseudoroseicyclus sp. CXY001]|uniref:MAPEG family protein n=1 Tax=Pseudoroseicyclus sp. CXY001 TaxID=3242492 RepID=UPI00358DCD36
MTADLFNLGLACLIVVANWLLLVWVGWRDVGRRAATGSRDDAAGLRPSPLTNRINRALTNSYQALALFTAAVVLVVLSDSAMGLTAILGWVFLAARAAYIPIYALDLNPWRSVVWAIGLVATLGLIVLALL